MVSLRTAAYPDVDLVLCTLGKGREHLVHRLVLSQRDEPIFTVIGAAVDMCGFHCLNGEPFNDWGPDDDSEVSASDKSDGSEQASDAGALTAKRRGAPMMTPPRTLRNRRMHS